MKTKITFMKVLFLVSVLFLGSLSVKAENCATAPAAAKTYVGAAFTDDATYTGTYVIMWKFRTNYAPVDFGFNSGIPATAYGGFTSILRFNTANTVDSYEGNYTDGTTTMIGYKADATYTYEANTDYFCKMVVNVVNQTYSSYVKKAGDEYTQIANNYKFREKVATIHTAYTYRSNTGTPTTMTLEELNQEVCDVWVGLPGTEPTAVNKLEANKSGLIIYPNPTKDYIQLSVGGSMLIYDIAGKLLTEKKNVIKNDKISVSNLSKGVYFVEVKDGNAIHTNKFVIE